MTRIYGAIDEFFDYKIITAIEPNTVWIEIGSERGEGSTVNLLAQAKKFNIKLYTVDISDWCSKNLNDVDLICHVATGSEWTKQFEKTVGAKISLVHLDNFDWIWNPYNVDTFIQKQIEDYKNKFGVLMNNQRCQQEHFTQILNLFPWLAQDCLIAMDDTFLDRGSWSGKSGPAVTWLKIQGFRVVATNAGGTVMARGYSQIPEFQTDSILNCIN